MWELDVFILFDPNSTHNFAFIDLATKLGAHDFEMGDTIIANGVFKRQEVSLTPLIGQLWLHIQGYMVKKDFFVFSLKHEDVVLGTPWYDCMDACVKFLDRKVLYS